MILDCLINFLLNLFKNKEYIQHDITDTIGVYVVDVDQIENIQNIQNYLIHHFDDSNIEFTDTVFKNPVYVKYKINSDMYMIALSKLSRRRTEPVIAGTKILCSSSKGINITELVNHFYGPNRNFYSDNSDSLTLKENKYFTNINTISTLNMLGQKKDLII